MVGPRRLEHQHYNLTPDQPMEALMPNQLTDLDRRGASFETCWSMQSLGVSTRRLLAAVQDGLRAMHTYEFLRAHGASHTSACDKACSFDR
jgi:hypothetical protein